MSRSGYNDDSCGSEWDMIRWRGAVNSALLGRRGQAFLREMLAALDAMEAKRLIGEELRRADGEVCAIGAVAVRRGLDVAKLDPYDFDTVAGQFNIAPALAREIVHMNDEWGDVKETPEARYLRMRNWVEAQICKPVQGDAPSE